MALELKNEPLEGRLSTLDEDTIIKLTESLAQREIRTTRSPHFKHDLVHRIVHYFRDKAVGFGDSYLSAGDYLNGSINKEPLKAVERGMRIKGISPEFLSQLDDFEKIYFFAGVDKLEEAPSNLLAMDGYEIASIYVRAGIEQIGYLHNSIAEETGQKRKVRRGHRKEVYRNLWTPPHSKKIRERLLTKAKVAERIERRYFSLYHEFGALFEEEDGLKSLSVDLFSRIGELERVNRLESLQERIALKLDSLRTNQLAALGMKYGAARLGGYAQITF